MCTSQVLESGVKTMWFMAIKTLLISTLRIATLSIFLAIPSALARPSCELDIDTWHKGKPFLYRDGDGDSQIGIYPELFSQIFSVIACDVTITYLPAARIKEKVSRKSSDISIVFRPLNSNYFLGAPEYDRQTPSNTNPIQERTKYRVIDTPIIYPLMSLIGRKDRTFNRITQQELRTLKVGSIRVPQRNAKFWADFFQLPNPPIGYHSALQGLKAVAAGRIDLFVFYGAAIEELENSNTLKIIKQIEPVEVRLLIHERALNTISENEIQRLNNQIHKLHADGWTESIIQKYSHPRYFYQPVESEN